MRIHAICRLDPSQAQPNTHYRLEVPLGELNRHGHSCRMWGALDLSEDPEVVIGHQITVPDPTLWRKVIGDRLFVMESDDDMLSPPPYMPLNPWRMMQGFAEAIRAADAVTVNTEPLAEAYARINKNVHVLDDCIQEMALDIPKASAKRVTVGWAGSVTHMSDFAETAGPITQALKLARAVGTECDLHFIGANYGWYFDYPSRHTPFTKTIRELYEALDFDVAIAPRSNDRGSQARGHLRALEAAARGIPVVASPAPAYEKFVRHGETGFIAHNAAEWVEYVLLLVRDDQLRERMGAAAKERARDFTIERRWREWEAVYSGTRTPAAGLGPLEINAPACAIFGAAPDND